MTDDDHGLYETSPVKPKRQRRTNTELERLRTEMYRVLEESHPMTVRQLFYQMTVRGAVPKEETGYDVVQRQLLWMRRNEVVPYSWVADNTRWMRKPRTFSSLDDALENVARTYRRALWDDQDAYVEVWCEKDALAGVIVDVTARFDVPLMVSRGFSSESYLYEAAQNIIAAHEAEKSTYLYYFGDHDPSGVLIDRNIREGLERLTGDAAEDFKFVRAAVTEDQIDTLSLPTRPTKSGRNTHARDFRGDSVELDAIPPDILREMVQEAIEEHLDRRAYELTKLAEKSERETLKTILDSRPRREDREEDEEEDE